MEYHSRPGPCGCLSNSRNGRWTWMPRAFEHESPPRRATWRKWSLRSVPPMPGCVHLPANGRSPKWWITWRRRTSVGAEELRHLIAGRRPPLPPVYEALRSGAGQWASWDLLVAELCAANRAMVEAIEGARDDPSPRLGPTVRTVVVVLSRVQDDKLEPRFFLLS